MCRIYAYRNGDIKSMVSLWDGLTAACPSLAGCRRPVLAFTGSGGKTTWIYALARELRRCGRRVLIMTTTRMYESAQGCVSEENIAGELARCGAVLCGVRDGKGKIGYMGDEAFRRIAALADIVLVEADGSRQMPLKVFGSHEPVLPPQTDCIIHVAGISAIGCRAGDVCFRWEEAELAVDFSVTEECFFRMAGDCVRDLQRRFSLPVIAVVNQWDDRKQPVPPDTFCRIAGNVVLLTSFDEAERTDVL